MVMVPRLLSLLRQEAPLVELVIRPESMNDLAEQIDLGHIDAAIGTFAHSATRFRSSSLFACDDVLITNSSRPLKNLSREVLSRLSIAAVSSRGEHPEVVEGFVCQRDLSRRAEMYDRAALERALSVSAQSPRIVVSLPHFLAVPTLLEQSDWSAIVPRPVAVSLARTQPISIYELPYHSSSFDVSALWHERTTNDLPQQWLLDLLARATEHLRHRSTNLPFSEGSASTHTHFRPPTHSTAEFTQRRPAATDCRLL
ncbi:LysR substrate-binding domain-containing protein [Bradyrhizobium sp. STM 3557]|uniref:LysR substrate-binding domain-containing protein n=1 Tax=Bradyrhizobium sp. STM 3557 TaxID=578920 RepID=UPI00388D672D